jgi:acetyl-CoA C-acetyltransferase
VQRQSASGIQAVANGIWSIQNEDADLILAGGTESMSQLPLEIHNARFKFNENTRIVFDPARTAEIGAQPIDIYGEITIADVSERIAKKYGFTEEEWLSWANRSLELSNLGAELQVMPLSAKQGKNIVNIEKDEPASTADLLARPADAAAVLLISSEEWAKDHTAAPIGVILSIAISAGNPADDGLVGSKAIAEALERANLSVKDIDFFYVLEISAAQVLAVRKELLDLGLAEDEADKRINPNGGALGTGNTFGAAGAVLTHDLLMHLKETGKQIGLVLACAEGGQAMAMIIERGM